MNNFYYQILVVTGRQDQLVFYITDTKIEYGNSIELNNKIKKIMKNMPNTGKVQQIISFEITKDKYDEFIKWYIDHSLPKDFITIQHNL